MTHVCKIVIDQDTLEFCDMPATKSVMIFGMDGYGRPFEDIAWLCDIHYGDPEVQEVWAGYGFEWEY